MCSIRNIAGSPVRGGNFFNREKLITTAWDLIEKGQHVLIVAPRRVGKTSVMYYLMDHPKPNYSFLYLITESVNSENEFFRRLVNKVIKTDHVQKSQKVLMYLKKNIPNVKKIGPEGVEFGPKDKLDYCEVLIRILKSSNPESGKLVIMLDEFPETLENIIRDEGESEGIHFLQSNRELRQDLESIKNVQFIYTGSIGLENIVSRLDSVSTIMDLTRLKIPPLRKEEASELFKSLLKNESFKISEKEINCVLDKIEWLIPFYIQLIFEEITAIVREERVKSVAEAIIEKAFSAMIERRNHFEHWHTRLRSSMNSVEYNFAKDLLNIASENGTIGSNEIYDLAVKYHLESTYRNLLGSLVYDGYINNLDDAKTYHYNSPILRMWWRQNVAN